MIVQPDLLVRDALVAAFEAVNQTPDLLIEQVFPGRPDTEQQIIVDYFVRTIPKVALGFPLSTGEIPGCYISIAQAPEDRQVIGSALEDLDAMPTDAHITEVMGTYFRATVRAGCWAVQADAAMYVQNVALWGLLRYRRDLQTEGLQEQSLALTDFEPVPEWNPDAAFRRDVLLSAIYPVTVQEAVLKIKTVHVTGHAVDPSPVTITLADRTRMRRRS